ncbi:MULTISPECIES: TetR/AcrR family transcriptional regulator [Pseudonocardia]|uniref:TetR family transcriptional regulator n=2 Tax=Pseudonocardia TaxID=1847 RepID=A0ABQ0S8U9_9PSEU|nr:MULTISPECIES: TetR family transcriptional regulator [Pseudonocardia]OSY34848.1 putative DNA-binding transcriptional regulator [Pseudonocardia autotrophica]TDN75453.1 TetR family transcriptional regulator [Pseudonocardia autotrophica]BBF99419.1 TetR family transcriptional regulator [Pseudonocardia autotrophica]GEC29345.1 TetR family transcriptional regulator [Pseudonocardia saturnea]
MPEPADGRLRKGERRRRALLEATLRLVGRHGAGAVTQRGVAAEARVPPSAVLYYFASVDELLLAALTTVHDRYVDRLAGVGTLAELVEVLREWSRQDLLLTVAEYELLLLAVRRPELTPQLRRWDDALEAAAVRLLPDAPERRPLLVAGVNGLCLAAVLGSPGDPSVLLRI